MFQKLSGVEEENKAQTEVLQPCAIPEIGTIFWIFS